MARYTFKIYIYIFIYKLHDITLQKYRGNICYVCLNNAFSELNVNKNRTKKHFQYEFYNLHKNVILFLIVRLCQ